MLRGARYQFLLVAPFAFLLTTCVHAPGEKSSLVGVPQETAGPVAPERAVAASQPPPPPSPIATWTERLEAVNVYNANTEQETAVRLYAQDGSIDGRELAAFSSVVAAKDAPPPPMSPRLIQLVMKAAYHFGSHSIVIVSAYRPSRARRPSGKHATGEAIDFKLRGIDSKKVASYVRGFPRTGVGIYTHPDTQYVHLDVRDESYHWLDASPPGKTWREKRLTDPQREERDAAYTPESDLPVE